MKTKSSREEKFPIRKTNKQTNKQTTRFKATVSKTVWHWYMNGQINGADIFLEIDYSRYRNLIYVKDGILNQLEKAVSLRNGYYYIHFYV